MISTEELYNRYGIPNVFGKGYLTKVKLPYPMVLSWDREIKVDYIRCHKLVRDNFEGVFSDILEEYGIDEIINLGIDIFGGCFNYRVTDGTDLLSTHSWAVAIDLDPERNRLRDDDRTANFAKQEYRPMIDAFYRNGFLSLGVERNFDWMHFEIAR